MSLAKAENRTQLYEPLFFEVVKLISLHIDSAARSLTKVCGIPVQFAVTSVWEEKVFSDCFGSHRSC